MRDYYYCAHFLALCFGVRRSLELILVNTVLYKLVKAKTALQLQSIIQQSHYFQAFTARGVIEY